MEESERVERLVDELSDPSAYDRDAEAVEVRQTHISLVFLVGDRVYKVKKPVDFGFVDYSTLERRERFCRREVELNRRLAPDVYLGVVPVIEKEGRLVVGGDGEPVEWAVEMVRLPDDATLESRLERGGVEADEIERVTERIAALHRRADRGPEIAEYARFEAVSENLLANFDESVDQVGTTVHREVYERARTRTREELESARERIEERADDDIPCDTHGDLRLDHVYVFPNRESPRDIEIIDCIEFNEAFRYADPVADVAFLVMDLEAGGYRRLAAKSARTYFASTGDTGGEPLLDLYVSYRAAVRAKVEGLKALEEEVPEDERRRARQTSAAHWLLALGRLEQPQLRPALVLVAGLPATGKSTLAARLSERANFRVLDTDVVRKQLAGLEPGEDASAEPGRGIYSDAWTDRTYGACRVRAEQALFGGERIIVDATFSSAARRRRFVELARRWGVPVVLLECTVSREEARRRIDSRSDGPSDADWEVYRHLEDSRDAYDPDFVGEVHEISTEGSVDASLDRAAAALETEGLV